MIQPRPARLSNALQFLACRLYLDNLVNALVLWNVEIVFLRNRGRNEAVWGSVNAIDITTARYAPSADEMSTLEVLDQWFGSRETDQRRRHERAAGA